MKRSLILSVALILALLVGATAAFAQTGPTGPITTGGSTAPAIQPTQSSNKMLPDRLAEVLKKLGHNVEIRKSTNGVVSVIAKVHQDNWNFEVNFEYSIDQSHFNVVCPLGVNASQYNASQLLELLKKSYNMNPVHFSVRGDNMVLLEDPLYYITNMTETNVRNILNSMTKAVRDTYPMWGAK